MKLWRPTANEFLPTLYPEVEFGMDVSIGENVQIGRGSVVGSGCRIYPGTRVGKNVQILENSVLGRPTVVPSKSVVKRSLSSDVGPLEVADDCVIGACVVLYRGSKIGPASIICDLASIREHCTLGTQVLIGRSVMIQVNTQIGNRVKIMDSCHLPGDMVVEDDVFLSTHVCGASENSLGRDDSTGKWSGPCLRKGAYVGVNATLLPGIEIGEDAVVGAGALVTRSVAPRTLVMGVPARPVRSVNERKDS
jgi:acetyltransferase-like isoleucine patch superfamily enzyme